MLVLAAAGLVGAVRLASLRYVVGESVFLIGHSLITGVNGMELNANGRGALIDADWNGAQFILRDAAPSNPRRRDITVTLFDAHGDRVPVVMRGCVSTSSVPVSINAPQPLPSGFVPIIFSRTPAPQAQHSQLVLRCTRISKT